MGDDAFFLQCVKTFLHQQFGMKDILKPP